MRLLRSIAFVAAVLCTVMPVHAQEPDEPRDAPRMSPAEYAQKLQYAQVYEEKHDPLNASRIYGELYALHPNDESVFDGYTRCLVLLKRYDEAEKIVTERMN